MSQAPEIPTNADKNTIVKAKMDYERQYGRGPKNEKLQEQIIRVILEHSWTSHPSGCHREMAHLLYILFGQIPAEFLCGPAVVYNTEAAKEFAASIRAMQGDPL